MGERRRNQIRCRVPNDDSENIKDIMVTNEISPSALFPCLTAGRMAVDSPTEIIAVKQPFTSVTAARRLLSLESEKDVTKITAVIPLIEEYLNRNFKERFPEGSDKQRVEWIGSHIFMQFIAHLLRNRCCPARETSYRQVETVVTQMAYL